MTTAFAQTDTIPTSLVENPVVVKIEKVGDNGARFLPTTRRIDRNINLNKFVYKGEWMLGIAASYGTLDVSDTDLMLLFDNIDFGLRRAAVMPYVAYSYRDNQAVGLRFGYEYLQGDLGNLELNLGSAADISFGLGDIGLKSESYAWSIFHRYFFGLDRRGIVGAILESELLFKTGTSSFYMGAGDERKYSMSKNFAAKLNLNPGLAVYVFPQVCVTVTVGIGSLYYNNIRQYDAVGVETGRRDHSALKFKLNIANIQIGVVAHLWKKKME
jgi:hypothetical protein